MANKYTRIIRAISARPWAIEPSKGEAICEIVSARAAGVKATREEIQAVVGASRSVGAKTVGGAVAVIPIYGVLSHRMDLFSDISGGTSYDGVRSSLRAALADPQVSAILLEIDSPGGNVDGLLELADEVFAARDQKPIGAIANTMAASAAFWLGAQVDEFAVTPSGLVGSVGVYLMHVDETAFNEKVGIKPTYVAAGKYKVEGNPDEPLTDEAREYLQSQVDAVYEQFITAIARGRKVSKKAAREDFGQGRMLMPAAACKAGMVDRVATFDEMVTRMASKGKRAGAKADTEDRPAFLARDEARAAETIDLPPVADAGAPTPEDDQAQIDRDQAALASARGAIESSL